MRKTKEEAEQTRRAILKSALDTFYEKGYSKSTFDEIAKRINLTKGAVYWHFRNKPDVVAAMINGYFHMQTAYVAQKLPKICCLDDILKYFLLNIELISSHDDYYKLAFFLSCQMEWSEAMITKIAGQVSENHKIQFNLIKEALTFAKNSGEIGENVDVEKTSHILFSIWSGTLDAYLSKRCQMNLTEMVADSFNLVFNGLKKEGTENAGK